MTTQKERTWIAEYLKCWNSSEAARRAGYKWPDKIGPRKRKKFNTEIQKRLRENAMEANEVLSRLGNMARSDIADFLTPGDTLDLKTAKARGLTPLIKSVTWTKQGIKIELYDAQAALVHIGKHLGLFTDRIKIEGDWRREIRDLLKSGDVTPEIVTDELGPELAQELFDSIGLVTVGGGKDSAEGS